MLPIRYSIRARLEEIELLEYVYREFGENSARKVYNKIESVLEGISNMPEAYPTSKKIKGLRKCVFSKQTSIYYRINGNHIELVSFRPNRKSPRKFKV